MNPSEYGEHLADQTPRISREQAEVAARILLAAERETAGEAA